MGCQFSFILETFIGQIIAFLAFFAFPAFQYILLKKLSKKVAQPELWYLPSYGFRLVIRNVPNKKTLSNIKYRTLVRQIIQSNSGSTTSTYQDSFLVDKDDFFLLPGIDQILINFNILGASEDSLIFLHTDILGARISEFVIKNFDQLISDYTANIENVLNFDIKVSTRVIINKKDLIEYWKTVKGSNKEQRLSCKQIINI